MMGLSPEAIIALVTLFLGLPLLCIGIYQLRLQIRALEDQRRPVDLFNGVPYGGRDHEYILPLHTYRALSVHTSQAYNYQAQTSLNFTPAVSAAYR
ncbi:hypothetical protein TWF102_003721 [Orbilia oligospora]|uniref:Uncharacterized protein n=2 Tax=Orbilia oligospora TaxID=2813651 RepID=A0A7C8NAG5_ORBOL|nr:hypothetical protein TWF102_003721 [Orbilia oligospora]KAF3105229.1 hypothetical protein TWF103_006690 [Orbilia oligospora]KAF3106162.1 hypothetical protein TWF706_003543 [Orbilia oligospora]